MAWATAGSEAMWDLTLKIHWSASDGFLSSRISKANTFFRIFSCTTLLPVSLSFFALITLRVALAMKLLAKLCHLWLLMTDWGLSPTPNATVGDL